MVWIWSVGRSPRRFAPRDDTSGVIWIWNVAAHQLVRFDIEGGLMFRAMAGVQLVRDWEKVSPAPIRGFPETDICI